MTNAHIYAITEGIQSWGAQFLAMAKALRGAGPVMTSITDTDLLVSQRAAGADMSVDVAAGSCIINGTTYTEAATVNVVITAAHASLDRYDLIVYDQSGGNPIAVAGTAAATPNPPDVTDDNDIPLAIVFVEHGDTSITDAEIFDLRCAGQRYPRAVGEVRLHAHIDFTVSQSADCTTGGAGIGSGFGGDSSSEVLCGQCVIPSDLIPAADENNFTFTAKLHVSAGMFAGAGTATLKLYDVTDSNELLATVTTTTQDVAQRIVSSALTVGTENQLVPGHTYKITVRSSNLNAAILYQAAIYIYQTQVV